MKIFKKNTLTAFYLTVFCLIIGTTNLTGQSLSLNVAQSPRETILSQILRDADQSKPFVLLTPSDLSKLSSGDQNNLMHASADPCALATPIIFNQTINGQLSNADCRLEDNSYADFYTFNGTAGQEVRISMNSAIYDAFLNFSNESGTFSVEDDDGGGGTNSLIVTRLPATGSYIVLANSIFPNQFGDYTITVNTACTYSLNPTNASIASAGGTFNFQVTAQTGCLWSAETGTNSFLSTNSSGNGNGTVSYTVQANESTNSRTGTMTIGGQVFTVTQQPLICAYTINPSSALIGAHGGTYSFSVSAQPNCAWQAQSSNPFITTNSTGFGSGTVNYTVPNNNGADRSGAINIGGRQFTVTQIGLNCAFAVTPSEISVDKFNNYGVFEITTQPGCLWSISDAPSWIVLDKMSGFGSQSVNYQITMNHQSTPRAGSIAVYGNNLIKVNVAQSAISSRTAYDFDSDGKADFAVFRPSTGIWYLNQTRNGSTALQFGSFNDELVPADYDGDGKTDIAVYRDGTWFINRSYLGFSAINFGEASDVPVPADYDGDGAADLAVWRPSNGIWFVYSFSNNNLMDVPVQFGASADQPAVGDYDGDGKADYAVYRPSSGTWYIRQSQNGFAAAQFGLATDKIIPADYDGDGKTDIAVYRPSSGSWYYLNSSDQKFVPMQFGNEHDVPVPADYDGDGKADLAVFRNGTWYVSGSASGLIDVNFGLLTDRPIPNAQFP